MSEPKAKLKGITDLGRVIDERIARRSAALHLKHGAGQAPEAPLSGGGTPGGGGGGEPALPETFVKTLRKQGEGDPLHGDIVLAASGDATLTQSSTAPHFVIASPEYTAADGVARVGNEFRADSTVVRTSGDQSIGGVKTFTSFPVTPAAAPDADYEVANKKYVEDSIPEVPEELWQRTGDVLSPKKANDVVDVETAVPNQNAITAYTSSSSGTGVGIHALTREGYGVWGSADAEASSSSMGVRGTAVAGVGVSGESADGYGVQGSVSGAGNAAYGGKFNRTHLGAWADQDEQGSDPATPQTGDVRCYGKPGPVAGSRQYMKSDTGVVYDLCVQSKETFWAAGGANATAGCAQRWAWGNMPGATGPPAPVTATQTCTFNTPTTSGDVGIMTASYCAFAWNSTYVAGKCSQSYVIVGAVSRLFPGDGGTTPCNTARVSARVKVNNASYFDKTELGIHDSAGTPVSLGVAIPPSTSWTDVTLTADISGWTAPLRVTVAAYGALHTDASRALEIDVEYLSLELWAE